MNFNNGSDITYGVCWSNGNCSGPAVLDGFCPPLPSSGSNLGVILGSIAGAVVVVSIAVGLAIYKKRKAKKNFPLLGE